MSKFGLVPRPEVCQARAGTLALPLNTVWTFSDQTNFALETLLQTYRDMLQSYLPTQTGWQVIAADGTAHWHFLTDTNLSESGYRLEIGTDGIWLTSSGYHGAWAGCMTVLQLLHTHYQAETMAIILPALYISDQPRFVWRGLHLDVSRHFFPIPFLKRLLDQLALHKLNVFHWHLTDDQGWRLEIKRYPKLTEIGAWRERTVVGHPLFTQTPVYNDQPHGGFYTQEQARELVAYASARGITIVPEIEMPGHAAAALAAYPAYSCNEHPWHVSPTWGVHQATFCPSKPETYVFLENILTEVAALFPGEYLHIGGDECPKAPWAAHDLCRKTVQQLDLPDFEALQSHFIQKIGGDFSQTR
jgi:hexosaminidase